KAEMQVKAMFAEEPLLRSILAQDPALAQMVQRTRGMPAAATHFERIRIGEAIAGAVQVRRAADEDALTRALAPFALANVLSPPHHERGVLNAAFLVDRSELSRFDERVEALSEEHAPEIEFKLIGPLPAYSFANDDRDVSGSKEVGVEWA
ncbi:MAG TPA: GvpL/GvpF family gas vesicle protein, partial [Solirubrobacteraceae bacterium]